MKFAAVALLALAACGKVAMTAAPPPEHVDVPPPAPEEPVLADPAPPPIALTALEEDDTPASLTGAWTPKDGPRIPYRDAVQSMHTAKTAFGAAFALVFGNDGGLPPASEYEKANAALEILNRRYAAMYYAPDATDAERISSLEQASELLLGWAEHLDAVGLDKVPKTYRTNGAVALTFEDVVHGPAKRWRGEGMSLAHACVARAKSTNVQTSAANDCSALVKKNAHLPTPPHARTQPECACDPGDPLCSASMSGWCKNK